MITEPQSYAEAISGPHSEDWKRAISEELASIESNGTWTESMLPPQSKPIKSKWIFKLKRDASGTINRFKARLVACGYSQVQGTDYNETFSPVSRMPTVRLLFAVAAHFDMTVMQYDVKTAFLYGTMDADVFISHPQGYVPTNPKSHLKLLKGLYGTKQAGRLWNIEVSKTLTDAGFTRSVYDPCLFYRSQGKSKIYLSLWVDDILIFHNSPDLLALAESALTSKYDLKKLGPAGFVLGIQVSRLPDGYALSQSTYIKTKAAEFAVTLPTGKNVDSPMIDGVTLDPRADNLPSNELDSLALLPYRQVIGSLMYAATTTRPDICYAVNKLARYGTNYTTSHWNAAIRVLQYCLSTADAALVYRKCSHLDPAVYVDANYSAADSARSTTGFTINLSGSSILWQSRRQKTVATSTMDAEYLALSDCVKEILWLRHLLLEIGLEQTSPTVVFEDNSAVIATIKSGENYSRVKHLEIRHHFFREHFGNHFTLQYCASASNVADCLTKPLSGSSFASHAQQLGLTFESGGLLEYDSPVIPTTA